MKNCAEGAKFFNSLIVKRHKMTECHTPFADFPDEKLKLSPTGGQPFPGGGADAPPSPPGGAAHVCMYKHTKSLFSI